MYTGAWTLFTLPLICTSEMKRLTEVMKCELFFVKLIVNNIPD